MTSNKIYVGNLSWNTTDEALRLAFQPYGNILDSIVMKDRDTGRSRGFGFVTYAAPQEAEGAINNMNEQELDGRRVKVNLANSTSKAGGGYGGGYSSGYNSGGGGYQGAGGYGGGGGYAGQGGGYGAYHQSNGQYPPYSSGGAPYAAQGQGYSNFSPQGGPGSGYGGAQGGQAQYGAGAYSGAPSSGYPAAEQGGNQGNYAPQY